MMSKKDKKVVVLKGKVDAVKWVTENNGYPEVGQFDEQKTLQKFYKQLTVEQLEEWAKLEGAEYKSCPEQPAIHRMRVAMAILYKHYPKETATKKESKYAKLTLEDLLAMAIENEVAVEPTEDERIMRMRTIMALRQAKVIE
jgi:hypothetical protein